MTGIKSFFAEWRPATNLKTGRQPKNQNIKENKLNKMNKLLTTILILLINSAIYGQSLVIFNSFKSGYGFKDASGNIIVPPKYDAAKLLFEGLATVKLNNKWRFIDNTGKKTFNAIYDDVQYYSNELILVKLKSKWGLIDKTGKDIILPKFDYIISNSEGMAGFLLNGKYGFLDSTGQEIIAAKYRGIGSFSEGLAAVKIDNKWGFINKTGREVIAPKYELKESTQQPGQFINGRSLILFASYVMGYNNQIASASGGGFAQECKEYLWVDSIGRENRFIVLDYKLYNMGIRPGEQSVYRSDPYRRVITNNKMGIVDEKYNIVVPTVHDTIYPVDNYVKIAIAQNLKTKTLTYIDLTTGKPYDWSYGKTEATYDLPDRQIVKYIHQVGKSYGENNGLKTTDGQVLLYPVCRYLQINGYTLTTEIYAKGFNYPWTKVTINITELGKNQIKLNTPVKCPKCAGSGNNLDLDGMAADRRASRTADKTETITKEKTTWERVWNPKTNNYDDVKGTTYTTTTKTTPGKTTYTSGDTIQDKFIKCSTCNGKGKFTSLIWDIENFTYKFR